MSKTFLYLGLMKAKRVLILSPRSVCFGLKVCNAVTLAKMAVEINK